MFAAVISAAASAVAGSSVTAVLRGTGAGRPAVGAPAVLLRGDMDALQLSGRDRLIYGRALEAVKQWEYEPTHLNGVPVEIQTSVQINYTLAK